MTDKQIIDCEYLKIDEMRTCKALDVSFYGDIICNDEDCIILKLKQQLKSKEQENKDLKEDIKDIANLLDLDTGEEYNFGNIELEIKQLKAKEQECDELKKEVNVFLTDIASCISYDGKSPANLNEVSICIEDICKVNQNLDKNATKYRQALQEIKELAKFQLKDDCKDFRILNCNIDVIKQILQKCEVIDE